MKKQRQHRELLAIENYPKVDKLSDKISKIFASGTKSIVLYKEGIIIGILYSLDYIEELLIEETNST